MLLTSYTEWRHCIEVKCGIKLTDEFILERLNELNDETNTKTYAFMQLYGASYTGLIISWFEKAKVNTKN